MKGSVAADGWNHRLTAEEGTSEERECARMTVAAHSLDKTDLMELLSMLGLGLTAEEWIEWQERKGRL